MKCPSTIFYIDANHSGSNFNRTAFKQILAEIDAGRIECIIVKDCCAIMGLNQKDLENQGILA